ncbi:hypothetical protein WN48_06563 [Eufriesea mexicana]|uniref:Uncharacterized protein n=1 Tax=Eufriesea mexicana TaxID=516756 RepID=A0A310S8K7_9HYME|nr:hypothetical protein WN48_06563 [Eufriesea mexicana]
MITMTTGLIYVAPNRCINLLESLHENHANIGDVLVYPADHVQNLGIPEMFPGATVCIRNCVSNSVWVGEDLCGLGGWMLSRKAGVTLDGLFFKANPVGFSTTTRTWRLSLVYGSLTSTGYVQTGACTAAPATMIITRKVARWALLLKREALGRNYGAQKRLEQAPRGATAMLPHSGRVDDNIDTDDTVATDLHRTSSCVALALPLPFPYYYYYYYPRAGIAASLFKSDRRTLTDRHEADSLLLIERIDEPQVQSISCFDFAASTEPIAKEQQDEEKHGEQETESVASPADKEAIVLASVDSNRHNRQNRVSLYSCIAFLRISTPHEVLLGQLSETLSVKPIYQNIFEYVAAQRHGATVDPGTRGHSLLQPPPPTTPLPPVLPLTYRVPTTGCAPTPLLILVSSTNAAITTTQLRSPLARPAADVATRCYGNRRLSCIRRLTGTISAEAPPRSSFACQSARQVITYEIFDLWTKNLGQGGIFAAALGGYRLRGTVFIIGNDQSPPKESATRDVMNACTYAYTRPDYGPWFTQVVTRCQRVSATQEMLVSWYKDRFWLVEGLLILSSHGSKGWLSSSYSLSDSLGYFKGLGLLARLLTTTSLWCITMCHRDIV